MDNDHAHALSFAAGYNNNYRFNKPSEVASLEEVERRYIEEVIAYCKGNIPRASRLLKVAPSTIYRKRARWYEQS